MATAVFAANNESYRRRLRAHRACQQCKRRRVRPLPSGPAMPGRETWLTHSAPLRTAVSEL